MKSTFKKEYCKYFKKVNCFSFNFKLTSSIYEKNKYNPQITPNLIKNFLFQIFDKNIPKQIQVIPINNIELLK